jgi:hypothetical protein
MPGYGLKSYRYCSNYAERYNIMSERKSKYRRKSIKLIRNNPELFGESVPEPEPSIKLAERDAMPREVAVSMLTEPRAKLNAPIRKACMTALAKHFVSTAEPKRYVTKLEERISRLDATQLCRRIRRLIARIAEYEKQRVGGVWLRASPEPKQRRDRREFLALAVTAAKQYLGLANTEMQRRAVAGRGYHDPNSEDPAVVFADRSRQRSVCCRKA